MSRMAMWAVTRASNRAIGWNEVIFDGLTINGIYGREMYETWHKMTGMM